MPSHSNKQIFSPIDQDEDQSSDSEQHHIVELNDSKHRGKMAPADKETNQIMSFIKKNKTLVGVIILVTILLVCVVLYFKYKKDEEEKNKNKSKEALKTDDKEQKDTPISSEEVDIASLQQAKQQNTQRIQQLKQQEQPQEPRQQSQSHPQEQGSPIIHPQLLAMIPPQVLPQFLTLTPQTAGVYTTINSISSIF